MTCVTITSTCYHMRYHTFSLRLEWFGAICNTLPRVTVKLINNIYNNICLKNITVTHCDALQIDQNQENLQKKYTATRGVIFSSYGNALP